MEENEKGNKVFTRRALLIGACQLSLISTLTGRLAWLQLVEGQKYKTLSDKNRINLKMLAPSRGIIVDRNGTYLAKNNQNFRILIVPEQTEDIRQTLQALSEVITLEQTVINRVIKNVKKTASFIPVEVVNNISWDDMAKVEAHLTDLPGISTDVGEVREYPLKESTAHLVGYVGAVTKSDLGKERVLSLPGFKIGKTGVERTFDIDLRGKEGASQVEVNVQGREVRDLNVHPSRPGKTITLTVDADLQSYTQERLSEEKSASAIIMDVHTGAVYALASAPSFDPNLFIKGLSAERWEELLSNPGLPLNNKAISGQYPPGSTFKMVTALAALEHGRINPYEKSILQRLLRIRK
jgi:penicillin-binding protein 2